MGIGILNRRVRGFSYPSVSRNTVSIKLDLDKEKLDKLAQISVNERVALTGVQPRISLNLNGEKGNRRKIPFHLF